MRRVVVESPYAGGVEAYVRYARAALLDCLARGEAPFASHLLYTQPGVLLDDDPQQRALGIAAGNVWRVVADATVVYVDLGMTSGMLAGVEDARLLGHPIERRTLPEW